MPPRASPDATEGGLQSDLAAESPSGNGSGNGNGNGAARPSLRPIRILPVPPPLPRDEDPEEAAAPVMASPAPRPRPVPPPVVGEQSYALRPTAEEGIADVRLAEQIDQLYRKTVETVSENRVLSEQCQNLLKKARAMLQSPAANLADVEVLLERVRAILARADRSVLASRRYGPPLAGYHILWLVLLLLLLVFDREAAGWLGRQIGRPDMSSLVNLVPFWMCMLWGGIGAVAGALYGLYRHLVQRDFDSEHKIGYVVQPVLGIVVGALVYLLTGALFSVVGEGQSFSATTIGIANPLALVAALAGFQQRHAYALLDSAVRRLLRAPARADSHGV